MICASVVLPVPGGPQKMSEPRSSRSICVRRGLPGATRCSCPTNSSSVRGRMRSASGRVRSDGHFRGMVEKKLIHLFHHGGTERDLAISSRSMTLGNALGFEVDLISNCQCTACCGNAMSQARRAFPFSSSLCLCASVVRSLSLLFASNLIQHNTRRHPRIQRFHMRRMRDGHDLIHCASRSRGTPAPSLPIKMANGPVSLASCSGVPLCEEVATRRSPRRASAAALRSTSTLAIGKPEYRSRRSPHHFRVERARPCLRRAALRLRQKPPPSARSSPDSPDPARPQSPAPVPWRFGQNIFQRKRLHRTSAATPCGRIAGDSGGKQFVGQQQASRHWRRSAAEAARPWSRRNSGRRRRGTSARCEWLPPQCACLQWRNARRASDRRRQRPHAVP